MKIKNILIITVLTITLFSMCTQGNNKRDNKTDVHLPKAYLGAWVYNKTDTIADLWLGDDEGELNLGGGYLGDGWSGYDCKVEKSDDYYIIEYTAAQEGDEWQWSVLLYMKNGYLYTALDDSIPKKMHKIIDQQ